LNRGLPVALKSDFGRLEPCAGKLARTVLRGGWCSNALSLPDPAAPVSYDVGFLNDDKHHQI
ncbi:MAG: hypothetical protein KKF08_08870, partial [Gammaproteobacteria bacterium]|nr:hypothetical protein [Gammaproteobacteria bacterium]